ncbi:MAG TPA: hypothetical protein VJL29_06440 [Thermoguttaceae bacterium]|nr:hypothetical protein [Thermoguttaceae bacterium]
MNERNMPSERKSSTSDSLFPVDTAAEVDLERRLRAEATADRPEFSETLHARIVEALPAETMPILRRPTSVERRRRLLAALAASLVVAVGLAAWQLRRPSDPGSVIVSNGAPDSTTESFAMDTVARTGGAEFGLMVDETLARGQWAYLDHDAKVAANMLMDQLPIELALSEP